MALLGGENSSSSIWKDYFVQTCELPKSEFLKLFFAVLISFFLGLHAAASMAQSACNNAPSIHESVGLYFPGRGDFYLTASDDSQYTKVVHLNPAGNRLLPVAGDWNQSGFDSVGVYDPETSTFYLKYTDSTGPDADIVFQYGTPGGGLLPVAGDWTGKGYKSVGLYNPANGTFSLRNANASGNADITLTLGGSYEGSVPITGDWVGDGITRVGLYQPSGSVFTLRMTNDPGDLTVKTFQYGWANNGYVPMAAKWTNTEGVGLRNGNVILEKFSLSGGNADVTATYAPVGNLFGTAPLSVVGKWPSAICPSGPQVNSSPSSPYWVPNAVIYELRVETFSEGTANGGYFKAATALLPQLQDLGITAISLDPIEDANPAGNVRFQNLYEPRMPDRLNSQLGTDEDFRDFVAAAHAAGIKVIVDNVVHGIDPHSPYITGVGVAALPPDYFVHNADGTITKTYWGTAQLDWTSSGLRDWWTQNIGLGWVQKYDIDGFRMDCEPDVAGSPVWEEIRNAVEQATGKNIVLMPEIAKPGRAYVFDMSQNDVGMASQAFDFYNGKANVVDTVKSLNENYYTSGISNHDSKQYNAKGKISAFAYGAVISPFIPRWYMGEEFNATPHFLVAGEPLYFSQLHWEDKDAHIGFYNQVKTLLAIRSHYLSILRSAGGPLKNTNIAKVDHYSGTDLEPYTMWNGSTSITLVASRNSPAGPITFSIPLAAMGMNEKAYASYLATDLMTGEQANYTAAQLTDGITMNLQSGGVIVLKIDGQRP